MPKFFFCKSTSFAVSCPCQSTSFAKDLVPKFFFCKSSKNSCRVFILKYKNHIIIKIFIKLIKNGISPRSCGHNS